MGYNNAPPGLSDNLSAILSAVGSIILGPVFLSSGIDAIRAIWNDLLYRPYAVPKNIKNVEEILGFSSWWKFRCIRAAVKHDLSVLKELEKSLVSIPDDELQRVNIGRNFVFGGNQNFFNSSINVSNDDGGNESDYYVKEVKVCVCP